MGSAIDIGSEAVDRGGYMALGNTRIDLYNPANLSGAINVIEVYGNGTMVGCKVGTFSGSSSTYTSRDFESLGDVPGGSKQIFTGLNCAVESGDYIGLYASSGGIQVSMDGGTGMRRNSTGDAFSGEAVEFDTYTAGRAMSVYGSGETLDAPTVTTQAVSSVTATSMVANGNITDTGGFGSDVTRRGFCYMEGTSGDPTTANSTTYDDGTFGTGAYTKSITGLSPSTSYRVRAYAVNAAGTAYGTTVDATTDASMADLNIQATYQSMAMTANAASLNSVINVSATTDAMSVTGYQATINVAVSVAATCASMSISALASDVDIDVTVNATCDALSLTENNVSINAEKNVSCTVDSLTTQTCPANINSKTRVAASVDSLVIAEYTASINKAVNASCFLDTMTLTSKAASVGILYNANASLVELIITTYGVSIDSGMAVAEVSSATSITPANLMVDKTSGYASILGMWMGGIGTRYSSDGWSTLLSVNDIASESTVEEVTITQEHILDVGALGSETGTESITVIRNDTLSVAGIESATSVETIVALVDKILAIEDMSSQATVDSIKLQYMNSLAIAMGANNLLDGGEAERCLRRM